MRIDRHKWLPVMRLALCTQCREPFKYSVAYLPEPVASKHKVFYKSVTFLCVRVCMKYHL
jgi:hypothetical protein